MPTLLHVTTVHPRHDARIFSKEVNSLARVRRHRSLLLVADGKGDLDDPAGRVSVRDLGHLGRSRLGRFVLGPWRAFSAIRRIHPALVHFHDPELIPLGILLKGMGYTVVYDVHEDVPRQTLSKDYIPFMIRFPVSLAMSILEWAAGNAFDAIIPATPKIAARFPEKKTVLVQNFPIRTELDSPDAVPYRQRGACFAYMGGISRLRGALEMIHALEHLSDVSGTTLELAGEFSPAAIETALRGLAGWASVRFHGHVPRHEVARIMGRVRAGLVVLHPTLSYMESYPVKMFEYMASGVPVIASDFPLWRKIVEGARCGVLVDPLSPKAIADAMRWILDHPEEAEAMGKRGRQAVEQTYNWDRESAKLIGLYQKLLNASTF